MLKRISRRLLRERVRLSRTYAELVGRQCWSLPIRGLGPVRVRTNSTDEAVFFQVFSKKEYDISHLPQSERIRNAYEDILSGGHLPIIVDAGANVGAASIWFAKNYPQARVVAVEPDRDNATMCRINTAAFATVKIIEGAVGCVPGLVSLKNSQWAVQTTRSDTDGEVRVHTISDLVAEQGPLARLFIVKIDIEGFEDDLFRTNVAWIDDAAAIMIEPHDWMLPERRTSSNFQRAMGERDFELLVSGENLVYVRLCGDGKCLTKKKIC